MLERQSISYHIIIIIIHEDASLALRALFTNLFEVDKRGGLSVGKFGSKTSTSISGSVSTSFCLNRIFLQRHHQLAIIHNPSLHNHTITKTHFDQRNINEIIIIELQSTPARTVWPIIKTLL